MDKRLRSLLVAEVSPGELAVAAATRDAERAGPANAFVARCREAGLQAWALDAMRRQRVEAGFVALPLAEYLEYLARCAGLAVERVCRALAVDRLEAVREWPADRAVRLGRRLGIRLRELVAHCQLGAIREQVMLPGLQPARAAGIEQTLSTVEDCEALIQGLRRDLDAGERARLDAIAWEIRCAYSAQER